jgi:rod shape determining protein RodA
MNSRLENRRSENRRIDNKPRIWEMIKPYVTVFDPILSFALLALCVLSIATMYSAAYDFPGRFAGHMRNIVIALLVTWMAANVKPSILMRVAVPLYITGVVLLICVAVFGDVSKGARRWLNLGFIRLQPSEILKIAMPLMLAWYFQRREGARTTLDFLLSLILLAIPAALIVRQPDLGTAILVTSAGAFVIFFAGLSYKVIFGLMALGAAVAPFYWEYVMHDYQRQRVLTLFDPTADPLGKGFHIIQSIIAVGSGGLFGKGWMEGTQTHLEFIPERTTDFILAVYAEEFGLVGVAVLLIVYAIFIGRALVISGNGANAFMRLLAGAIALIYAVYAFVNMGMVSGILPVVGVPLPWMSYGGTAMVTLGLGAGLLMSLNRHRKLVQT